MPWLVRDGKVLATLEVQTSLRGRARGLLGRDGIDGAILLRPARSVHSFRMRFPIDVAICDRDLTVLKVTTLVPHRATRPVLRAHSVIECEAGMLRKWGVVPGTRFEVTGADEVRRPGIRERLRLPWRRSRTSTAPSTSTSSSTSSSSSSSSSSSHEPTGR
jgi:uncharacterized membrane protein (UPF0127 family)